MVPRPDRSPTDGTAPARALSPNRIAAVIAFVGLAITVSVTWTAWTLNAHNEHRLLLAMRWCSPAPSA